MPVPTLVTDLSTTVASNSPAGSDNVFPDLDNYLRALSGFVASIRDNSGNGWVSPYLPLTYSAGTANGVVYLNGSKVVTTGSALVFDGTNLGIGTSSPGEKLAVNQGNIYALRTGGAKLRLADQNNEVSVESSPTGVVSNMIFKTAAATQMTLDSSGNLGLGVTPSAWISNAKAVQVGSFLAAWTGSNGSANLGFGVYEGGAVNTYKYLTTGDAPTMYQQITGQHRWFTAPSGTTGNTISFTQAMTLDASGNLLVGTTATTGGRATISAVANYNDLATGYSLVLSNTAGTGSNANPINVGVIQFGNPSVTNADIGRLSVVQENPGGSTASSMRFFTNGGGGNAQTLERARITSGGDLLVGTTDAAATATTNGLVCSGTNPGFVISRRSTGAAQTHFEFRNGGTNVGNITSSTTTTTYATTSDRRLKDNIAPAPSASDVIDAIEIVSHDWKAAPDEHVAYGVIAQDLALVAPQAVLQGDDGEEIEKTWGVDYSKLVPMLIKEIQTLRARVAALEAA